MEIVGWGGGARKGRIGRKEEERTKVESEKEVLQGKENCEK
jgi:hypothetical protein